MAFAAAPARAAVSNPLFAYPHLLPSPYTLPAGTLSYGTVFAFGLTDFLQVSTNVLLDFNEIWNAQSKLSLVDYQEFALSFTLGVTRYNLEDLDSANPDITVTSWQPGVVTAWGFGDQLALFVGGNLDLRKEEAVTEGIRTSGYAPGMTLNADLSFAYNPPEKRGGVGNVLSAGVSYDATYELFGAGVSHHWPGFQLGVHFYPGADQNRFLPIIAGGGSVNL